MTREEFMEDAQVGQVVKIYTVTGDIYLGSVDSFGPSGVKIIQIENNVPKRIMYERISEYDVDVEEQALKTSALEKSLYAIDRSAIFSSKGIDISFAYIINLFESLIDKKEKSSYARVQDIIDYAKKIDEYERTSDRVIKAIAELKILSEQNPLSKLYIAAIQFDFNDFRASADNCFACKQYELAFYLYKKAADSEMMFKSAALSISSTKDEYIIRWLCEYAVKINNGQIIKKIVMENDSYANEAMIYWFCTSALLAGVDSIEQARLDVNIKKMKEAINKIGDAGAEIFSFTHEMQKSAKESPSKIQNSKRTGTISYYNRNGGNGYIRENDGNTIYFYIKQVKDYELQKILSVSDNVWIRVTYVRGINHMGIAAADCIEMIDGQQEEVNAPSSVQKGYIYEYDRFSQYGKISAGDKLYNFKFDAIKDPFLRADIESSYVELEYDVKFCLQKRINKGKNKVETVAYDIVGEKEYSDETIAEWVRSGILSQSEIDAWISKDDCKEERKYRISPYEPLKSREAGKARSVSAGNIQNPKTHLIDDQEKQICKDIIKDVENPFVSMPKISGGKNYRAQARKYSVGTKTDQNEKALLEKAEALFIKAIQADEQLASTISDLANIYIRLGSYENSYIIKGLQLLDVYDYLLSGESLMHMRIQLIDKSEFKDAQEKILENSIKKCTKKNTLYHYMSKLAGFHLKMGNYEHAKKLFKECAEFLDENKSIFANYEIMKLWPIRSIIIADYYAGDKEDAIQKAKEFLLSNPDDTTIRSIAEGNADEAEKDEIMDDVVDSIPYDDESMDDTFLVSELFSAYASYVLDSCEYSQVRDRVIDDETGRYIWIPENEDKANGVYDSIAHSSSIFGNDGKLRPGTYAEVADKRLNMAKIAEYCLNNTTDLNLTSKKITLWKGRFIWATAHYMWLAYNINSIKQQSSQDAASYFLIECINMFFKDSNYEFRYEFYDAINRFCIIQSRMSSSDFAQIEIKRAENLNKHRVGPKKVEQEIELMENVVCDTFKKIFDNDSKLAIRILGTILENSNKEAVLYFVRIFSSLAENLKAELINEFGYNNDWSLQDMLTDYSQELHKSYEVFISDLKETSSLITNSNFGGLERVVNRIENALKNEKMMPLCNTDIERCKKLAEQVNNFITLKSKLSSNYEISQERANSIKNEAAYLHREYMDNPTRVSFDALCDLMELIRDEMVKVSDDITQQSLPEITVENEYEEEGYFPHNEKINLMLLISNGKTGKQCTTASDIQLDIDYDDELKKYIHIGQTHFNLLESLPGGEHSSQQITLHLTNEGVIPDTIFAMKVRVSYQTIKGTGDYVDAVLNLHIKSEDAFEEITNPYGKQTLKPGESNEALFKGRSADVANIGNQLLAGGQGKTVLIYGQYRSGKTSLANFIIKEVEMRDESVVMTRSITVAEKDNAWDIVDKIISHICRALKHRYKSLPEVLNEYYTIDVTENNYEKIFTNFTQDLYEVVMEQGIHILVTLDEFGRFFKNNTSDRFMQLWKSVMELGAFNALLIGHDVVTQMMRADINSFGVINTYQINYIDFEATQQVVTEPTRMKDQRTRFTDNAIQYIWEQSAGNAYYIQLICQATINFMNKRHINIVNEVYVKQAIEEWLNNDADESAYLDYGHPLYLSGEIGENAANERETKIVLDAISRCQNFASIDEIVAFSLEHYGQEEQVTKSIVYSLRARRVVDQDEENGKIFIRCKFYPDFLNSQIIRSIE